MLTTQPGGVRLGSGSRPMIELLHRPDAIPDDRRTAGLYHTAFLLPARSELGRWLRHAARIGQGLDGKADHRVSEAVYLSDPEGNGIEMYADRPPDTWRWRDGEIEMGNQPLDLAELMRDVGPDAPVDWTEAPPAMTIGHVHLRVGDAGSAARFYTGRLGLRATLQMPNAAFLSWEGYHHHMACNDWQSRGAGPRDPKMAGLHSVTVRLPEGRELPEGNDPWGTRIITTFQAGGSE